MVTVLLLATPPHTQSSDSYTGDSALYYLTCDGKISATVPLPNGGPVHCAVFGTRPCCCRVTSERG